MASRSTPPGYVPAGFSVPAVAAALAALAAIVLTLAGCANAPRRNREEPPAPPPVPERTSDRGDRFVLPAPIGQMAPEDAPPAPAPPRR